MVRERQNDHNREIQQRNEVKIEGVETAERRNKMLRRIWKRRKEIHRGKNNENIDKEEFKTHGKWNIVERRKKG